MSRRRPIAEKRLTLIRTCGTCGKTFSTTAESPWIRQVPRDGKKQATNGYIRQGVVGYEGLTPVIGIAIGQDIKVTGAKETVGGVEYETIDTTQNMSIWTADKLSFYVSGREVAYFANDALTVTNIHTGSITMGSWTVDASGGYSIRWTGENS